MSICRSLCDSLKVASLRLRTTTSSPSVVSFTSVSMLSKKEKKMVEKREVELTSQIISFVQRAVGGPWRKRSSMGHELRRRKISAVPSSLISSARISKSVRDALKGVFAWRSALPLQIESPSPRSPPCRHTPSSWSARSSSILPLSVPLLSKVEGNLCKISASLLSFFFVCENRTKKKLVERERTKRALSSCAQSPSAASL